ncbi:hypothetical protein CNMCM6936_006904 [Aspergillus lentulus]|nr:hypothetical protein CNMCM6936_006904 [Aspergillus lentulus]
MRNPEGLTLLCLAVIHGDLNLVRTLLSRGARQDRRHVAVINSPIQIAAFQGAKDVVDLLLHYGPDPTRPNTSQLQDAIQCALVEGHGDILPLLLATGVSLNYVFRGCRVVYTPLVWAVDNGDIQLLQLLLAGGKANPNFWSRDREAIPLLKAVLGQYQEMVQILVGPTSRLQRTRALALSMDYSDGRIAQILLTNGALPDFEEGDHSTLKQIFGDIPDAIDDILMPPLIRAVLRGHTNLAKLLVARGANINVEYRGWIKELPTWVIGGPLALAEQLGDQETANFLRDQGAKRDVGTWLDRFEKLGKKKRNESMEEWLSEWENIIHECEDAGLVGYSGHHASLKFINVIDPLLPVYAKVRHANLEPGSTPSILEEISAFRHGWVSASDEEKQSSFATFQGQSDQSNCSNQRKCICGNFHRFIDCPYIILSKDPVGWKADPKIEPGFEKFKKTRENMNVTIERALEQTNQELRANLTFL